MNRTLGPAAASTSTPPGQQRGRSVGRGLHPPRYSAIWIATALLFAVSPALAPGSISQSALVSMLPFAAVLAIASIGQTLVIQQRGLDLSVAGMMTLSAVLVTTIPSGDSSEAPACDRGRRGRVSRFGSRERSRDQRYRSHAARRDAGDERTAQRSRPQHYEWRVDCFGDQRPRELRAGEVARRSEYCIDRGSVLLLDGDDPRVSVLETAVVAVGTSSAAARAAGIRVKAYEFGTYLVASLSYGVAAILISGYLETPSRRLGDDYLLPTIAAVVLGGTFLTGGQGSVAATAVGRSFSRNSVRL